MTPRGNAHVPGLVWTLIRTDLKTRYHGSFGGYLWALLKPFTMFVVLLAVFSFVFRMDPNYNIHLIIGLFLWDFFAESTKTGLGALHAKSYLLTKARFPSWILPLTSISNALVNLTFFSLVVCCYIRIFKRPLSVIEVGLFFGYLLLFLVIVIGFSLAASVLFLRFRDLNQVWDLALQAGFFLAPVIYPLDIIPERFHFFLYAWLPTPVIQFSRQVLVTGEVPSLRAHAFLVVSAAAVLVAGVVIFRRFLPGSLEEL